MIALSLASLFPQLKGKKHIYIIITIIFMIFMISTIKKVNFLFYVSSFLRFRLIGGYSGWWPLIGD